MRLVAALAAVVLAPAALAGGSQVDLIASPRAVFVVGDAGLRELDAATGHTIWAPTPTEARYDLSVAVTGGALWVASIANGYVDGRLTRIDLHSHAERVVLRVPHGSVLEVAAGAGGVCALVGEKTGNRLVRFTRAGARDGAWGVGDAGHVVADETGCWVSANRRLLHLDRAGQLDVIAHVPFGSLAVGDGAVWIGLRRALIRVDEHTGTPRTIRTGELGLGGFQHDLAVGNGFLWTLGTGALQRRDATSGRLLAATLVPRIADSAAVTRTAIWIGTTQGVRRLDPRTLRTTLRIRAV